MAESAAHLVDEVFPSVGVRQWVLSFPMPIRFILAQNAGFQARCLTIVHRAITTYLQKKAWRQGLRAPIQPGAVTLIQRFGGSLNLNVHYQNDVDSAVPEKDLAQETLRIHLTRFFGCLAPHAKIRSQIVPAPLPVRSPAASGIEDRAVAASERPAPAQRWAELLARVFGIDMQKCVDCGGPLKVVSAILEPNAIRSILTHLRLPDKPPDLAPAQIPEQTPLHTPSGERL